jgi:hypothetical protein
VKRFKEYYTKSGAYRKSPEDDDTGLPKRYVSGLSDKEAEAKAKELSRRAKLSDDDPSAYEPHSTDKDVETRSSKYTQAYKKQFGESIEAVRNKADESGISFSILKQVYDRGMAAWKGGHRPGTTPHQWALARVNSFITGGKTRSTADKDLWAKHQGKAESIYEEAEYDGRKVSLDKPFRTPDGPKKFGVYVRNDKGNVVLVRFGDPDMDIKRDDPERRKNFRARHGCDTDPGPKWKAKYWSCKFWAGKSVSDILDD